MALPYGSQAIDAILFDLDDVLVPFQTPGAWQWAWRPQGPVLGERRVRAAVRRSLRSWDRRRWRGLTGKEPPADLAALNQHLLSTLFEIAGHPLPANEAEAVVRRLQKPAGEVERFPDVAPMIERLKAANIPWGVVTSLSNDSARWLLRRVGVDQSHLLLTAEASPSLPDRAAFRGAADRLGVPFERVAFVGDLFWSDDRAAARAGLPSLLLDRHDAWPKVQAGRIVGLADLESGLAAGGSPPGADDDTDAEEG
ncbi:MAG: HAD family hydrolase [Thermoplasmata archaeon]